jgi:predicted transcriptional regulator
MNKQIPKQTEAFEKGAYVKVSWFAHKRDRLKIYLEVLKVLRRGESKPTRIMYKANLSWTPLKRILDSLQEQKIVEVTIFRKHKFYTLTKKGVDVLEYFRNAELEVD